MFSQRTVQSDANRQCCELLQAFAPIIQMLGFEDDDPELQAQAAKRFGPQQCSKKSDFVIVLIWSFFNQVFNENPGY